MMFIISLSTTLFLLMFFVSGILIVSEHGFNRVADLIIAFVICVALSGSVWWVLTTVGVVL